MLYNQNNSLRFILFLIVVLISTRTYAQQQNLDEKTSLIIHSQADQADHRLLMQLPKGYGKSAQKYPVIILFDAQDQSLFDYASTTVDRLMGTNDIPEAILVGIIQNDRSKELGVERSEATAALFLQFVKDDLLKLLNDHYHVNGYYTFIGHSLGGQFVTYAMTRYPDIFRSVISISGALNYPVNDPEYSFYKRKVLTQVKRYLNDSTPHSTQQKYYFAVGTDGMQDNMFRLGATFLDSLLNKHNPSFLNWRFDLLNDFNHMTTPMGSIPAGLLFIYHDWHFSEDLAMDVVLKQKTDGLLAIMQQEEKIGKHYGTPINLPTFIYYQFAHNYLKKQQFYQAKQVTGKLIKIRPNDDKPYALMADILIGQGNKKEAIELLKLAQSKSTGEKYLKKIDALTHE